ncbi:tyrosinase family protein [Caulobacter mirabilis]|uniref:Tyrosinase copper-binding domain-containing protein n=1 Tax=Caulobacter mirabilis TaxID=69666 RepID=A0A2D2AXZ0_9CAUL|nr:tyrosinase family protein [Caulobacter mirabilis]ATQ42874.1 hypothetical protein CSW64_10860 [Caulobacter mirabilis]
MTSVTRRAALVGGGATIPFAQWYASQSWARAPFVRKDLSTPAGQADLAKYAKAVKIMSGLAEANPRGWMFQWYIHAVRGDRTKAAELARVYPAPSPQRTLAQASWSTCQAHSAGTVENYFLPWHRMYVFFLEAICRKLLQDNSFVLPYWRYTQPNQRALPVAFRQQASPQWGTLYRPNRNPGINNGVPIDQGLNPTPINTLSLNQTSYVPAAGQQGFCLNIDANLHGSVHVRVGNGQGMGSVPWAANDPIFWMHHCNIDRMWASWNRNGGCNPTDATWLNKTFTFPDANGNSVVAKIGDFKSIGALGYTYDVFEPGPRIGGCLPFVLNVRDLPLLAVQRRPFKLDPGGPVEIKLEATSAEAMRGNPKNLGITKRTGRTLLVIDGLQAKVQPGVLYEVGVKDAAGKTTVVGHLNFFDAVSAEHGDHGDHGGAMPEKFFAFDVTRYIKKGEQPTVVLRPDGKADAQADAVVTGFSLVQD